MQKCVGRLQRHGCHAAETRVSCCIHGCHAAETRVSCCRDTGVMLQTHGCHVADTRVSCCRDTGVTLLLVHFISAQHPDVWKIYGIKKSIQYIHCLKDLHIFWGITYWTSTPSQVVMQRQRLVATANCLAEINVSEPSTCCAEFGHDGESPQLDHLCVTCMTYLSSQPSPQLDHLCVWRNWAVNNRQCQTPILR